MILKRKDYVEIEQALESLMEERGHIDERFIEVLRGRDEQTLIFTKSQSELTVYNGTNGSRDVVLQFDLGYFRLMPMFDIVTTFLEHYYPPMRKA